MAKNGVSTPTTTGDRGQPPGLPGIKKFGKGVKSPTTQGDRGIPPKVSVKNRTAPRD